MRWNRGGLSPAYRLPCRLRCSVGHKHPSLMTLYFLCIPVPFSALASAAVNTLRRCVCADAHEPEDKYEFYTLAALQKKLAHPRIDLLKMDIEGEPNSHGCASLSSICCSRVRVLPVVSLGWG